MPGPDVQTSFLIDELAALDDSGLRRRLRTVRGAQGRYLSLDGREVLNFSSNNYLGIADHPALVEAAKRALGFAGLGAGASRLIAGSTEEHVALEQELASFAGGDAALVFNSGYHANLGIIPALVGPGDVVFSDELNHATIIDGCRLSRARVAVVPHCDMQALGAALRRERRARRRLVVSDAVFSMDGDRAPVAELAEVSRQHGAVLMLDEAHAVGVLGPGGAGLAAEAGIDADVRMGTLGKALGTFGAFAVGPEPLVELLVNRARSFVFTTALPPSVIAAGRAGVELARGEEGERRRERLFERVAEFRDGLARVGLLARDAGTTPIFPVMVGEERRAMEACEALLDAGIYAQGIRPPTVPRGTSRLRFALSAAHEQEDIERAVAELAGLAERNVIPRASRATSRRREAK